MAPKARDEVLTRQARVGRRGRWTDCGGHGVLKPGFQVRPQTQGTAGADGHAGVQAPTDRGELAEHLALRRAIHRLALALALDNADVDRFLPSPALAAVDGANRYLCMINGSGSLLYGQGTCPEDARRLDRRASNVSPRAAPDVLAPGQARVPGARRTSRSRRRWWAGAQRRAEALGCCLSHTYRLRSRFNHRAAVVIRADARLPRGPMNNMFAHMPVRRRRPCGRGQRACATRTSLGCGRHR